MGYVQDIRKKIGHDMLIIVGTGILLHRDHKLLMQKRCDNGCWAMHGGGLELGETVEEGAKRELFEETGLTANSLALLGVYSGNDNTHQYPNGDQVSVVGIIYMCDDFSGEPVGQPEEILELRWFDMDELPENIHPLDKKPLEDFLNHMREHGKTPA